MTDSSMLKNHFLLSMPHLESDYFSASLIYLCDHNKDGAMGLVVNKPTDLELKDILQQLELISEETEFVKEPVFLGGPVAEDRGFLLHRKDQRIWKSSLELSDQLSLTTSVDLLSELAQNRGPEQYLFTLGYSGWEAGQLEDEIGRNLWLSCPASLDILFNLEPDKKLNAAAALLGIDLSLMSTQVGHG